MTAPLQSLVATGTKLWLDSIDPKLVELSKSQGATGATSNPIIVANIVKTGLMDGMIRELRAADDLGGLAQADGRARPASADLHRADAGGR